METETPCRPYNVMPVKDALIDFHFKYFWDNAYNVRLVTSKYGKILTTSLKNAARTSIRGGRR